MAPEKVVLYRMLEQGQHCDVPLQELTTEYIKSLQKPPASFDSATLLDTTRTYSDLKKLIQGVEEGWRNLKLSIITRDDWRVVLMPEQTALRFEPVKDTTGSVLYEVCILRVTGTPVAPSQVVQPLPRSPYARSVGSPSSMGTPESMKLLQEDKDEGPLVLCHRPPGAKALPFALLHPVFGEFMDNSMGRGKKYPTIEDYEFVINLSYVAAQYHVDERSRKVAMNKIFEKWLGGVLLKRDGILVTHNGFAMMWIEYKLEVGQGNTDPNAETLIHFFHWLVLKRYTSFLMPGFALEVFGPFCRIGGIMNVGKPAYEPLTPALHLLDLRPHQPEYMEYVTRCFMALRVGLLSLEKAYERGKLAHMQSSNLPYMLNDSGNIVAMPMLYSQQCNELGMMPTFQLARVTSYDDDKGEDVSSARASTATATPPSDALSAAWAIENRGSEGQVEPMFSTPRKLIYAHIDSTGKETVVKFCTQYNVDLHRALAAKGLAPELLGEPQCYPGGWTMVRMEPLHSPWVTLQDCLETCDESTVPAAIAAAESALMTLHQLSAPNLERMVWGDARPNNIMVRWDASGSVQVKLLDFDWSGKESEASYPGFLNTLVPWPKGVAPHKPMKQEHDLSLFKELTELASTRRSLGIISLAYSAPASRTVGARVRKSALFRRSLTFWLGQQRVLRRALAIKTAPAAAACIFSHRPLNNLAAYVVGL